MLRAGVQSSPGRRSGKLGPLTGLANGKRGEGGGAAEGEASTSAADVVRALHELELVLVA